MSALALVVVLFLLAVHVVLVVRWPVLAVISALVAMLGLWMWFDRQDSIAGMVASPAPLLVTAWALLINRRRVPASNWLRRMAICLGFAICLLLAVFASLVLGYVGLLGWVLFIVWLIALVHALLESRRAFVEDVISTLAVAVRQNLPLPSALDAAAGDRRDKPARVLRNVAAYMAEGAPLSYALRMGFRACPGRVLGLITAAEHIGQVAPALRSIEQDLAQHRRDRRAPRPMHPAYPILMVLVTLAVACLFGLTLPRFSMIFGGFGIELPGPTKAFIQFGLPLVKVVAGAALPLVLLVGVIWVYTALRPRRPGRLRWLFLLGDAVKWRLPVLRWFERKRSLLQLIEHLRLSLLAGTTIDDAIASALELDLNACFQPRLRRWLAAVRRGEDPSASARACGLGEPLAWAFDKQANPGRTPEALEFLEAFYRSNCSYKAKIAYYALWPCLTLGLAVLVGTMALVIMLPVMHITAGAVASFP